MICCALVLAVTAQTPPPQSAPAGIVAIPLKTPRHLAYRFTVSYHETGEAHDSGFTAGGTGAEGSGVISMMGDGGRSGRIDADVVAFTTNGGLVVKIAETKEQPAPQQRGRTFQCIVYSDGGKSCGSLASAGSTAVVVGPTGEENALLGFLGRNFIDPARMDANGHWRIDRNGRDSTLVADYTVKDSGDGKTATILEHSKFDARNASIGIVSDDAQVQYDRALSVPDRIHDARQQIWSSSQLETVVDLTLTVDSYSGGTAQNAPRAPL